ncbi:MAG: hypothetical protein WA324_14795 [Bryobacteraceae bacterium]
MSSSPISELAAAELRAVAMALRSGRVALPCSVLSLRKVLGQGVKHGTAEWLNAIAIRGCTAEATASWLELFADSYEQRDATDQGVQVVSTAPVGDIAMHRDTAVVAQDLFRRATHSLLISSYGIFGGRQIFRSLAARMESNPELRVRLFMNIAGEVAMPDFVADFTTTTGQRGLGCRRFFTTCARTIRSTPERMLCCMRNAL